MADYNSYIDKLDNKQTLAMLIEIDNNYKSISKKIPAPIYDKLGRLKNAKEIKEALKELKPQLDKVWDNNLEIVDKYSKMTMTNNYIVFDLLKSKLNMTAGDITVEKWNKIQDKLLADRQKKIKIQQAIKGNKNHLNKQVQKTVNDMYRNGKSWIQTQKELKKQYSYNSMRAKRIAITEKWYYRSEAQLQGAKGLDVYKTWIHSGKPNEPRPTHLEASKKAVVRGIDNYFTIGDYKTIAPQHFGIASEDINCRCTMRIDLVDEVDLAPSEIQEAIDRYNNPNKYNYDDITNSFKFAGSNNSLIKKYNIGDEFEYDGNKYKVDDHSVQFKPTQDELDTAEWINKELGYDVTMVPKINEPEKIKTADYIFNNEKWDLKNKSGVDKQAIYHAIRDSKGQANNYIIDFSKSSLSINEILDQVSSSYKRTDINFYKLIVKKNDDFFVYKRK